MCRMQYHIISGKTWHGHISGYQAFSQKLFWATIPGLVSLNHDISSQVLEYVHNNGWLVAKYYLSVDLISCPHYLIPRHQWEHLNLWIRFSEHFMTSRIKKSTFLSFDEDNHGISVISELPATKLRAVLLWHARQTYPDYTIQNSDLIFAYLRHAYASVVL